MSKQAPAIPNDQKRASFDPADFLPDESVDELPEGMDFGDDFVPTDGDDDDDVPVTDDESEDEEPEDDAEEGETEEAPEDDAEETVEPEEAPAEEEPTEEAEPSEEEPAPKPRGKPGHMIPKARLDHQIALTRDMQKKIAALEQEASDAKAAAVKAAQIPDEQIQGWLKEANEKALAGDMDDAAALQTKAFSAMQSNRGESSQAQQKAIDADQLRAQLKEELKVDSLVEKVFADYPMLDPNGDVFDEDMNNEALEYQDYFISKGYEPSTAIEKAIGMLSNAHGIKATSAKAEEPAVAKKPERDVTVPVAKKLAASKQQPAEPQGRRGNKSAPEDTVDIYSMNDEQLMALPESVRAKLRGDY